MQRLKELNNRVGEITQKQSQRLPDFVLEKFNRMIMQGDLILVQLQRVDHKLVKKAPFFIRIALESILIGAERITLLAPSIRIRIP